MKHVCFDQTSDLVCGITIPMWYSVGVLEVGILRRAASTDHYCQHETRIGTLDGIGRERNTRCFRTQSDAEAQRTSESTAPEFRSRKHHRNHPGRPKAGCNLRQQSPGPGRMYDAGVPEGTVRR